jgi:hypothetical protein
MVCKLSPAFIAGFLFYGVGSPLVTEEKIAAINPLVGVSDLSKLIL